MHIQLLPISLEKLVQKIIEDDKNMEKKQIQELLEKQGDLAQTVAKHINQTSANRCLYATQILLNVHDTLNTVLKTDDLQEIKKCALTIKDQLELYKKQVIDKNGIV